MLVEFACVWVFVGEVEVPVSTTPLVLVGESEVGMSEVEVGASEVEVGVMMSDTCGP